MSSPCENEETVRKDAVVHAGTAAGSGEVAEGTDE